MRSPGVLVLRSGPVSVLADDGFIFGSDRLKSPLCGLLESALAFQCSGVVSDDGFIFSAAWPFLIGAGSPAVFRAVWSRSLGRCFINPCRMVSDEKKR